MSNHASMPMVNEHYLPTISSKVMFWRPRYLCDSKWLQHIPFYFWLTEVLRPQRVVEPNINSGVGYFAICQAIDKLNLDTMALASFGSKANQQVLNQYNYDNYREFSELFTRTEAEFLAEFPDHNIDLLLLKHDSELLSDKELFEQQLAKLAINAVVLIHGSKNELNRSYWRQLARQYPSFELSQGQGLLLLCVGSQIPPRLNMFIEQCQEQGSNRLIQDVYARLGCANEDAWLRAANEQQLSLLGLQLQDQNHTLAEYQQHKQQLEQQLQQSESEIVERQSKLHELQQQLAELSQHNHQTEQNREHLLQQQALLQQQIADSNHHKLNAERQIKQLQQDIDVRFDELATLTQMLTDADEVLAQTNQAKQVLQQAFDVLEQKNQTLLKQFEDAKTQQQALQSSNHQHEINSAKLVKKLADLGASVASSQKQVQVLESSNKQLITQQLNWQQTHQQDKESLVELTQKLTDAYKQIETTELKFKEIGTQSEQLISQLEKSQDLNQMLERDQQIAAQSISTLKQSELALQTSVTQRFDELATLTNLLTEKDEQIALLQAKLEQLQQTNQDNSLITEQIALSLSEKVKHKLKHAKSKRAKLKQFVLDAELISQSELFNEAWYLAQYPDAEKHKFGAAGHYLAYGVELGTNPSLDFDGNWYLQTHQDVKNAGMNPLFHYIKFGQTESRLINSYK